MSGQKTRDTVLREDRGEREGGGNGLHASAPIFLKGSPEPHQAVQ